MTSDEWLEIDAEPIDGYEHDHETVFADSRPIHQVCLFREAEAVDEDD